MNKLDLEETTRRFHNVYEQVAKEYGYKTREDTKELDFNSPNGMTMLKTVETITTPYLEEIERLNNIINEFEDILKRDIKACNNKFENMFDRNYRRLILEEKLEQLQELKGSDKN